MSNFMKICPVGAKLFHVDGQDGQTYDKINGFLQFCKCT
jgi:hypothetical protein